MEILGRRSLVLGVKFMVSSPIVFLYNTSIIFFTLLFALFLRKRVFGIVLISIVWLICGLRTLWYLAIVSHHLLRLTF